MKRTTTREIFIEIETIRVTRKRSVRRNTTEPPGKDVPRGAERLFDKFS